MLYVEVICYTFYSVNFTSLTAMVIAKEMHKIYCKIVLSTCLKEFFFVLWGDYFFSSARVELEVEGANFSQRLETALTLRNHITKQIQTAVKGGTATEIASTVSAIWPEEVLKQQFLHDNWMGCWYFLKCYGKGFDKRGLREVNVGGGDGIKAIELIWIWI